MREFHIQKPCDAAEVEFQQLWGTWAVVTLTDVGSVLGELQAPWWVAGGWAIDAFTGCRREHSDVDVAMFRADLPALRESVGGCTSGWRGRTGFVRSTSAFPMSPIRCGCARMPCRPG
jgi:hypothetical protein